VEEQKAAQEFGLALLMVEAELLVVLRARRDRLLVAELPGPDLEGLLKVVLVEVGPDQRADLAALWVRLGEEHQAEDRLVAALTGDLGEELHYIHSC
jgi:hypothetical protein